MERTEESGKTIHDETFDEIYPGNKTVVTRNRF